jgi:hypothetical protein
MASLLHTISRFARSKQGRRLADQAVRAAKDPKTRKQIDAARRKLMGGGRTPPR